MSRGENPWDNAAIEAFNKSLKTELVNKTHLFMSSEKAQNTLLEYIEIFYNPKRLHSSLGYKTPIEYEKMLFNS
jgi:putative transposase